MTWNQTFIWKMQNRTENPTYPSDLRDRKHYEHSVLLQQFIKYLAHKSRRSWQA